ncbi:MAG: GTPase HflX [Rhodospirillales bacterium]|nr:GTPase HflX [Rhodospirillales bacterium]
MQKRTRPKPDPAGPLTGTEKPAPYLADANTVRSGDACAVLHPRFKSASSLSRTERDEQLLGEAVGLAHAINLQVVHAETITLNSPRPATLFGKGVVERLHNLFWDIDNLSAPCEITVVIVDATLTPVQQRNLEKAWECKVIDRTGLILEIFGERARTREGRLQVELAALDYQRSRLVRSWTHLERQRGGAGFMGGPGETQIETDRRLIGKRITRLKRELKDVKRTRLLHRQARQKVPYPVVALVGYTNAGKSTLFNRLTKATVEAKDQLFATLDPTMRGLEVPSGQTAILSDTVGFISQLPHELIRAFQATLEEVVEADIIIHVRDGAHVDTESQKIDVLAVLKDLGLGDAIEGSLIEVLNKIDLLTPADKEALANQSTRSNIPSILLSAVTGEGCDALIAAIDTRITERFQVVDVSLSLSDGASLAWLYEHGDVVERLDDDKAITLKVRIDAANWARFERRV